MKLRKIIFSVLIFSIILTGASFATDIAIEEIQTTQVYETWKNLSEEEKR